MVGAWSGRGPGVVRPNFGVERINFGVERLNFAVVPSTPKINQNGNKTALITYFRVHEYYENHRV